MSEPKSIPVSDEARHAIETEAAKRGVPVQTYMDEMLGKSNPRARRGLADPDSRANFRQYVDSMREFSELAPTLLMMRAMGMGSMMGGSENGDGKLTRRDLEELLDRRRSRRDDDDDDDDPIGRKMEKMAMRQMNYKLYAQMLGGDTTEGKAAQKLADKYDLEIKELRKAYEDTKEATAEKLEVEKAERHKAELEARDRELAALRDDMLRLQEAMNTRQEQPPPWAQMKEMASSLIAAKEAWGSVEATFAKPPEPPGKEAPLVEKLGHVLDRGASAAKDFLVGMGALQAGQRGIPPSQIGQVPAPPMPGPMPDMMPNQGPPGPPAPAETAEVYYDGEGNPISPQEFAAQTQQPES